MPASAYLDLPGVKVLLVDLTRDADGPSLDERAEAAMRLVRSAGVPRSVRGLLDLTGTPLDATGRAVLKRMSRHNGPWMKCVAFVGLGPGLAPVFSLFLSLTGRSNHRTFRTREQALAWLVSQ
jgi:hypothetical protein